MGATGSTGSQGGEGTEGAKAQKAPEERPERLEPRGLRERQALRERPGQQEPPVRLVKPARRVPQGRTAPTVRPARLGSTGATGATGKTGAAVVNGEGASGPALNRGETVEDVATCPAGQVVLGGGGVIETTPAGPGGVVGALKSSSPTAANAWTAVAVVTAGKAGGEIHVTAFAICGNA